MNSDSSSRRTGVIVVVALAVVAITAVAWRGWSQQQAAHAVLREESQRLQAQLNDRESTIKQLQARIRQLQGMPAIAAAAEDGQRSVDTVGVELELSRRLLQLTLLQSNMLALVERLTTEVSALDSVAAAPGGAQAKASVLEKYLSQYQQQSEEAKQKTASYQLTLNVPPQIANMSAKEALDNANLAGYWPYFQARSDRETAEAQIARLTRQLERARINASIEAATSGAR